MSYAGSSSEKLDVFTSFSGDFIRLGKTVKDTAMSQNSRDGRDGRDDEEINQVDGE